MASKELPEHSNPPTIKKSPPANSETYTPPQTPPATTSSAHTFFAQIQNIHTTLTTLPNLTPGSEINALLTSLVNLCTRPYSPTLLSTFLSLPSLPPLLATLHPLLATAEAELEWHWARHICHAASLDGAGAASKRNELLALFPYYENYVELSRLEGSSLDAFLPAPPRRVAFVGSGPLPLSSVGLCERYPGARVWNVDRDGEALGVSRELCERLGYAGSMEFESEDVSSSQAGSGMEWEEFDVVFLAALVGMDGEAKRGILASLARRMRVGALVVARSARGMRSVLYPVLELGDMEEIGLEILSEVHPWTKVVNSVVVMRVTER